MVSAVGKETYLSYGRQLAGLASSVQGFSVHTSTIATCQLPRAASIENRVGIVTN